MAGAAARLPAIAEGDPSPKGRDREGGPEGTAVFYHYAKWRARDT